VRLSELIKDRSKENTIWDYIIPIGLTLIEFFLIYGFSFMLVSRSESEAGIASSLGGYGLDFSIFTLIIIGGLYLLTKYLSRFHRVLFFPAIGVIAFAFYVLTLIAEGLPPPQYGLSFTFFKMSIFFAIITAFGMGYTVGSLILYIIYWIGGRIK